MESKLYLNTDEYQVTSKKLIEENDNYKQYFVTVSTNGKLIERPIQLKKNKRIIYENYNDFKELNIEQIDKTWIYNIIDHKAESNDIIFENSDIIIIPDYKWDQNLKNLHILGIFKEKNLSCIRDLKGNMINILEDSIKNGKKIIKEKYNIENLIIYFHYRPSVWQLHIHFMNAESNDKKSFSLPRAHLASTVIDNLKNDTDYYCKAILEVFI
jgi:hypothetical protein